MNRGQTSKTAPPLTDLEEILAMPGVTIPASALVSSITPVDRVGDGYHYNIEFTAPREELDAWILEMTGGPIEWLSVLDGSDGGWMFRVDDVFGMSEVEPGSRITHSGSNVKTTRCNYWILVNAPDFTRVNLGIETFDRW